MCISQASIDITTASRISCAQKLTTSDLRNCQYSFRVQREDPVIVALESGNQQCSRIPEMSV